MKICHHSRAITQLNLRKMTGKNPNLVLINYNLVKFCLDILSSNPVYWVEILSGDILTSINGLVKKLRKMTGNNPNLDLDIINANAKFGENLSICS